MSDDTGVSGRLLDCVMSDASTNEIISKFRFHAESDWESFPTGLPLRDRTKFRLELLTLQLQLGQVILILPGNYAFDLFHRGVNPVPW